MSVRLSPRLVTMLRIILAVILLGGVLRVVDVERTLSVLARVDFAHVVLVLILFGAGQFLSCVRWRLALTRIAARSPPILTLLRLYLVGMFINLGLPTTTGGDILRAEIIQRLIGGRGSAYASIIIDRMIGVVAIVAVASCAAFLIGTRMDDDTRYVVVIASLATPALLLSALACLRIAGRLLGGTRLFPVIEALCALAAKPRLLAASLTIALFVQICAVVVPTAVLAAAMGINVPFTTHLALVPVIVLTTIVPIAPNGIGVRETAFVLLYGQFGVGADQAFALGFAWSAVLTFFGLIGGLLILCVRRRRRPEEFVSQ